MKQKRSVFQAFTMIIQFGLNMIVPIVMVALAGFRNIFIMAKKIYQNDNNDSKVKEE